MYIGITKDIKKRWISNGIQYKNCSLFWNAIQKYGWNGFNHVVLIDNITKELACIIERELIKKYNTQDSNFGYNISYGGTSGNGLKGENHPNSKPVYQYNLDGTFIRKWENAQRASEELNISVSDIHVNCRCNNGVKRAGKYMWSYVKVEYMEPYNRIGFCFEPIIQLDKNFNIIQRYDSIRFVDSTIYNKEKVTYCCTRKNLTHKNYYWCYEKDFNDSFFEYINNRIYNIHNNKKSHKIYKCDLEFNILKIYNDAYEAKELTGKSDITIRAYCKRPEMNHGIHTGYIWIYEDNYEKVKADGINVKPKNQKTD